MAKPTAVTESGTAKVLLLADSSATTPGANTPAAITAGTSGDATYPIGMLGVATHRAGDVLGSPGGFTLGSPTVLAGARDGNGTVRPLQSDENGVLLTSPRYGLNLPLTQPGGAVTISALAETEITTKDAARFGYLTQIQAMCVGPVLGGTGAGSWTLKDGSAGGVLQVLPGVQGTPALGTLFTFPLPVPWKTNAINKAFTITPSSTFLGTWMFLANGFMSVV